MTTTKFRELTGDYVVDAASTRVGFVARHTMATKVAGHFEAFAGRAHLDGDDPSKSTAELTISAASIQTSNPPRDKALRDKFVDATNHPTITFASTEVIQVNDTGVVVTGDLTIRGTTNPVAVSLTLTDATDDRLAFTGTATVNRRDWGVHWPAAGFLVSKSVTLDLAITATRLP